MPPEMNDGADAPAVEHARPQDGGTPANQPDPNDIDAAELRAAYAAAEAEERATQEKHEAPIGSEAAPQGDDQAPAETDQPSERAPSAVPYERFAKVNTDLRNARDDAEFFKGKAEALESVIKGGGAANAPQNPAQPTQQPAPVPATDPIRQMRDAIQSEAKRYDQGEITLSEYEAFRMEREDQIQAIHLQRVQETVARQATQPSMADEAMLSAHAQQLDQQYPYLPAMSQEQLFKLRDMAVFQAQQEGRPFGNSANDTRRLRETVAQLSVGFGPAWGVQLPASSEGNTQATRKASGAPPMSEAAAARLRKHGMAADMPPDTNNMGTAGNGEVFTDQRIAQMTDEEIMALPPTVRQRFLSG
jgi:hypothetical protein